MINIVPYLPHSLLICQLETIINTNRFVLKKINIFSTNIDIFIHVQVQVLYDTDSFLFTFITY